MYISWRGCQTLILSLRFLKVKSDYENKKRILKDKIRYFEIKFDPFPEREGAFNIIFY